MKRFLTITLLICIVGIKLHGQNYFIAFHNKDTLDQSQIEATLSSRSIERRLSQSILYDSTDMPIKQDYIDSLSTYNLTPIFKSKWLNGILVDIDNDTLITFLETLDFVDYVHDITQTAVGGGINTYDEASYGDSWDAINFLNADDFHNNGNLGEGKLIAVFDGGFSGVNTATPFTHLFDDNLIKDAYSFVHNNDNVYQSNSHGTNVLSLIAANQEGVFRGVSCEAEIALYLTENVSSETILEEYNWVFAAERADSLGVDLINSSLGYYDFDYSATNHVFAELDSETSVITRGAQTAAQKGILVVSSSGNSHQTSIWPYINFPGDAKDVLTVGAIDYNGSVASYSSRGPINNSYIKPELVAPGSSISVLNNTGEAFTSSGTSFAAPLICGYAALVWNNNPELSALEIKQLLMDHASNSTTPNNTIGYGFPITDQLTSLNPDGIDLIKNITYTNIKGQTFSEKPTLAGLYMVTLEYTSGLVEIEKTIVY